MDKALSGLRVIDFSWILAGPALTRYLADYGAEVIKIESTIHPDQVRATPPYKDGKPGLNRSVFWANYNCNKYGMALNLGHPKSPGIIKRLVAEADVVVESADDYQAWLQNAARQPLQPGLSDAVGEYGERKQLKNPGWATVPPAPPPQVNVPGSNTLPHDA